MKTVMFSFSLLRIRVALKVKTEVALSVPYDYSRILFLVFLGQKSYLNHLCPTLKSTYFCMHIVFK